MQQDLNHKFHHSYVTGGGQPLIRIEGITSQSIESMDPTNDSSRTPHVAADKMKKDGSAFISMDKQ